MQYTYKQLNRIFFKSDDAKHIGKKPGCTFRALNHILVKFGSILFKFFDAKKVMAFLMVYQLQRYRPGY